jgi:hypothetical protein
VLADFCMPDGSLREKSTKGKKLEVILRYVVKVFQPGVNYALKQINETLFRFH